MSIIGYLLFGLVAGALARLFVPGRDPMGWIGTIVLGLVGSFVGGMLADLLFDDEAIGLFGAVVGAIIVLLAYNALVRNRRGFARS
ncbi:MAG TPA: GlsB/YeaQ/YmgE family stress response membrane protein [Acidimicrobiia bacterium]|nr:GlsB/YeaQ/YmgE family stress response membrane protein [Acidimicrobiia bacterium]